MQAGGHEINILLQRIPTSNYTTIVQCLAKETHVEEHVSPRNGEGTGSALMSLKKILTPEQKYNILRYASKKSTDAGSGFRFCGGLMGSY